MILLALLSTLVPLWTNVHRDATGHPSSRQLAMFSDAAGWADQHVSGPRWWYYVKGTRTEKATLPESWYLHTAAGQRIRDAKRHRLYVMDPANAGWRRTVAAACPTRCFLDGLGIGAYGRAHGIQESAGGWNHAVAGLIALVASHAAVLPNSAATLAEARLYTTAAGRASTEGFTSLADLSLVRAGHVWVFGKTHRRCGLLLATYLMAEGRGDHFSCFNLGTTPWTVPPSLLGPRIGRPLGAATRTATEYRRRFRYATVTVTRTGSYRIR